MRRRATADGDWAAHVGVPLHRVSLKYQDFSSSLFIVDQLSFDVAVAPLPHPFAPLDAERLPVPDRSYPFRRRTRRAWCNAPAQLDGNERSLIGVCHDISLGGMFFLGPVLPVGETVGVTMDLPSLGRLRLAGEVLDHRHHRNGSGMAIRFARLNQGDLTMISRFVAARSS